MRYLVILLLLSACAGVPESQMGTYDSSGRYIGPDSWGYARNLGPAAGANCFNPGYPSALGTAGYGSYNCATPLLFYSRSAYTPYYPVPASAPAPAVVPVRATHVPRPHSTHTGHTAGTAHKSAGHRGKRK